jgi:hypothetical protein
MMQDEQDQYPRPNWKHWLQVETISLTDAVALSFDVDPGAVEIRSKMVFISTIADVQEHRYRYSTGRPAPDEFVERWNITYSAVGASLRAVNLHAHQTRGELPRIETNEFAAWVIAKGWQIPDELRQIATTKTVSPAVNQQSNPLARALEVAKATRRQSRLLPFWDDIEKQIMTWLEDNGCPAGGDGNQAGLERDTIKWIEARGNKAGPSTVRRHVRSCMERYREQLIPLDQGHLGR